MEYVIGILGLLGVGFLIAKFSGKKPDFTEHEKEDAKLAGEQEAKEEELDAIEKRIANIEKRVKEMNPDEIEDYWNE